MKFIRLTPPGRSAIASLLIEGDVMSVLQKCVQLAPKSLAALQENDFSQPFFGRFFLNPSQSLAEEAVFCIKNQTQLEIHTHGGEAVLAAVENVLRETFGATSLTWCEWIASQQKNCDLPDQEFLALQKIPFAKTERIAKILLDQYNGAFRREQNEIQSLIQQGNHELVEKRTKKLEENARLGLRILEPFRIVLYGSVNSGKSSLLNAVLGFSRVIAHNEPGTTRDTVAVGSVVDGWPVTFFDTAGIRDTEHVLECRGIEKTHEILKHADLVLRLLDLSSSATPQEILHKNTLTVFTKSDLPQVQQRLESLDFNEYGDTICVSAINGTGIESLLEKISTFLIPDPPQFGEAVPLTQYGCYFFPFPS